MAAGAPDEALVLLSIAERGPLDELDRARVDLVRAQIAFAVNRGSDAPPLLLKAAKRLEPLDVDLARDTYLEAIFAALFAGRLSDGAGVLEAAQAARSAPPPHNRRGRPTSSWMATRTLSRTGIPSGRRCCASGACVRQQGHSGRRGSAVRVPRFLRGTGNMDEEGYRALPTRRSSSRATPGRSWCCR